MPLSQAEKEQLMLIIAEEDHEVYRTITAQEQQISYAQRLVDILGQVPSDRTKIPSLNNKIRKELAIYKDTKKVFGCVYGDLDVWTTQWCDSRKLYDYSEWNKRLRDFAPAKRDYDYCLFWSKSQLESGITQIHSVNVDLLEKSRHKFKPELKSRHISATEFLREIKDVWRQIPYNTEAIWLAGEMEPQVLPHVSFDQSLSKLWSATLGCCMLSYYVRWEDSIKQVSLRQTFHSWYQSSNHLGTNP